MVTLDLRHSEADAFEKLLTAQLVLAEQGQGWRIAEQRVAQCFAEVFPSPLPGLAGVAVVYGGDGVESPLLPAGLRRSPAVDLASCSAITEEYRDTFSF